MKTSGMRRALALANVFNLLVAIYFIVISIISLIHLRWYHQLTIITKTRHIITSTTSYFAFLIILAVACVLVAIFVIGTSRFSTKIYISAFKNQDEATTSSSKTVVLTEQHPTTSSSSGSSKPTSASHQEQQRRRLLRDQTDASSRQFNNNNNNNNNNNDNNGELVRDSDSRDESSRSESKNFCSMLLNLIAAIGLIVIIVIWLLNTGELVRDSISTQLDYAFARYQFSNRSNHYSVAIDAMQNINNCCGSLDYTDFPHQRVSGLSTGHYPGSCCGKNIFGVLARVLCTPEEIVRAKQTTGCVIAIANHYDLVSLLIVPVSLASLFVCIMVMAMMTLLKGQDMSQSSRLQHHQHHHHHHHHQPTHSRFTIRSPVESKLEPDATTTVQTTSKSITNELPILVPGTDMNHQPAGETVSIH